MSSIYNSVVDLHEHPARPCCEDLAVAAPALVKNWPLPPQKLVGELSKTDMTLFTLGLPADNDIPIPGE